MTGIRIDDQGEVATDPAQFEEAVALVRERDLPGLWIRDDFLAKQPDAPTVDLSLLRELSSLRRFGIAEGVGLHRVRSFEVIHELAQLDKLAIYEYPSLDLARLPALQILMIRDSPKLEGLAELRQLRELRIVGLRDGDLSLLADAPLTELFLIRAKPGALTGLDRLESLVELQLSHCGKLSELGPLPPRLRTLKIIKCAKLTDLEFLRDNPTLEFLFATTLDSLGFVASLARLAYLGFDKLGDGDLSPILCSPSLRDVGFVPKKHYSHTLAQIRAALAKRTQP